MDLVHQMKQGDTWEMKIVCAVALTTTLLLTGSLFAADKKGDPTKGKEVFEQCAVCHSATTDQKKMGPSLKGLYKKEKLANGSPVTDESILAMVNKGKGSMPAFADMLSDEEKTDLLAYLKTL
jgi:mono/diheme cytochrome c family protein